ncbi:ORF6N domain-containing protein [bacterium]|nr:ORF6N domain-containing protein [bacterium]
MDIIKIESIEKVIIELRDVKVVVDKDVAEIYGVETKRINEAVKNNSNKFPLDYMFEVTSHEFDVLRSKFSTTKFAKNRRLPKVFTEKGLYMLATILKGKKAVNATFYIIETFAKIRALSTNVRELALTTDEKEQKDLMQNSGEIITDILGDTVISDESETTVELNFAVLKFKHTIRKKKEKR